MLGTIKLPNNMKLVHDSLPASNYKSDKEKKKKEKVQKMVLE
jgi:hypothetical protein